MPATLAATVKRRTSKTVVTEHATRMLSLRAIEFRPELLQARASLDVKWKAQYAADMRKGDDFPAILVYELPDGRLVCADGFHRAAAAESIGLTEVRAQVVAGTMQDALLAAIAANRADFHRGRPFEQSDRMHAAELMVRDKAMRAWSDMEIERRTGAHKRVIVDVRLRLRDEAGIPLPEKVLAFRDGVPTGRKAPYRIASARNGRGPAITAWDGDFSARIGGRNVHLGSDREAAVTRLDALLAARTAGNRMLRNVGRLSEFLAHRGIRAAGRGVGAMGGALVGDALLMPVPDADQAATLRAIGKAVLARVESPGIARMILVGYFGSIRWGGMRVPALCACLAPPIEFMTPEELVAEFGGTEPDAPGV